MSRSTIAARDLAALILAATCWGVGTVISKAALDEISPFTLLPIQLAASLAVLSILMRHKGISFRTEGSPLLGRLGLLNPGLAYALGLIGLTTITASLYVLLWAFEPLMILFLAAWFLRERITPAFVVLSLIAVAGMVVIVYDPVASSSQLIGVGLTLAGILCCAIYSVVTRRWIPGAKETSQVILSQQAHALILSIGLVLVVGLAGGQIVPTSLTPLGVASAMGSGVLYYAGAYWFYLGALRHVPASYAALSFYLIPIVGVVAGAVLLGERLDPRQWIGAVIVLGAILAIIRRPSAQAVDMPAIARGLTPEGRWSRRQPATVNCKEVPPIAEAKSRVRRVHPVIRPSRGPAHTWSVRRSAFPRRAGH
jgi:drug/metabolite transporter (DMT)-like permease